MKKKTKLSPRARKKEMTGVNLRAIQERLDLLECRIGRIKNELEEFYLIYRINLESHSTRLINLETKKRSGKP